MQLAQGMLDPPVLWSLEILLPVLRLWWEKVPCQQWLLSSLLPAGDTGPPSCQRVTPVLCPGSGDPCPAAFYRSLTEAQKPDTVTPPVCPKRDLKKSHISLMTGELFSPTFIYHLPKFWKLESYLQFDGGYPRFEGWPGICGWNWWCPVFPSGILPWCTRGSEGKPLKLLTDGGAVWRPGAMPRGWGG